MTGREEAEYRRRFMERAGKGKKITTDVMWEKRRVELLREGAEVNTGEEVGCRGSGVTGSFELFGLRAGNGSPSTHPLFSLLFPFFFKC